MKQRQNSPIMRLKVFNMSANVDELLYLNNVDVEKFNEELYHVLLISTFATMVKEIDSAGAWQSVKDKFRQSSDHRHVIRLLVKKYIGGVYRDEDYRLLYRLLDARLRKKEQRISYPESTKEDLLRKQNHRCCICGGELQHDNAELDHVVPWSLVGDELKDNLQMLCVTCNRRKNATIDYALLSTFLRRD